MLVFKLNIFFYLSLLLIIVESIEKPSFNDEMPGVLSNTKYSECTLYNGEHEKWFLHAHREVRRSGMIRNVTLARFTLFTDVKQDVWQFIPVQNLPNGFFMRNLKFGEDLFATNDFVGINQKRREIYTWRYQKAYHLNEKAFMWVIKRSDADPNRYTIWNAGYKEPLYAGTYLWKGGVYTWHQDKIEGNQFYWRFQCVGKSPI